MTKNPSRFIQSFTFVPYQRKMGKSTYSVIYLHHLMRNSYLTHPIDKANFPTSTILSKKKVVLSSHNLGNFGHISDISDFNRLLD